MASYRVEVSATAEKQILRLARDHQIRVLRAIRALRDVGSCAATRTSIESGSGCTGSSIVSKNIVSSSSS